MSVITARLSETELSENERNRFTRVVQNAADTAYRARVQTALARRVGESGLADLCRSKHVAGITLARWDALGTSAREAVSPAEFQAFSRVLRVSARWLAVGDREDDRDGLGYEAPPIGWEEFGSHVAQPGVRLEFSTRVDEGGMPKWERPAR